MWSASSSLWLRSSWRSVSSPTDSQFREKRPAGSTFGTRRRSLVSLAGAATSIIRVCRDRSMLAVRKYYCRDKHVFEATKDLSRQAYFCRDKSMFCLDKHVLLLSLQIFVATKICLSRRRFCRDEHTFVATKGVFCRSKNTCGRLYVKSFPSAFLIG